jgi:hypothetical protein
MINHMTIDAEMARQKRYEDICGELKRTDLPSSRIGEALLHNVLA